MTVMRHVAVIAAKPPSLAKSRLRLAADVRRDLATAFALDVLAAVRAVASIDETVLMTTDRDLVAAAETVSVPDPVPGDLNASLAAVAADFPDRPVVALLADLPALRPEELDDALRAADRLRVTEGARTAFVADAEGTGTSCVAAIGSSFASSFGPDSAALHLARGAVPLEGSWPGLRADVDDLAGLQRALALGVGARTQAVMAEH